MRHLHTVLVFALVLLLPALAFAGGAAAAPADDLGDALGKLLVGTVVGAISMLGSQLWGWLRQKKHTAKLVRYAESHGLIQLLAQEAIDYVEELAHQAVKRNNPLSGDVKLKEATDRGLELLDRVGFTKKDRDRAATDLKKIILARLGAGRGAGGVRALAMPLRST